MNTVSIEIGGRRIPVGGGHLGKLYRGTRSPAFVLGRTLLALEAGAPVGKLPAYLPRTAVAAAHDMEFAPRAIPGLRLVVKAGAAGRLEVRRAGRTLPGIPVRNGEAVRVPEGYAAVSVSLEAAARSASRIRGALGPVTAGERAEGTARVVVTNHKLFPETAPAEEALAAAFARFILPFDIEGIEGLQEGEAFAYEFLGSLALGAEGAWGLSGIRLGAGSPAELVRAVSSELGSAVVRLEQGVELGVRASASFRLAGAFRIAVRCPLRGEAFGGKLLISVERARRREWNVAASARAKLGRVQARVDADPEQLAGAVLERLAAQAPLAGEAAAWIPPELQTRMKRAAERFLRETNRRLEEAASRASGTHGIAFATGRRRASRLLAEYAIDPAVSGAVEEGYALAAKGDFFGAARAPGVELLPGSFLERETAKHTWLSLRLFGLERHSAREFFRRSIVKYAGGGEFSIRDRQGLRRISGKKRSVEIFFTTAARRRKRGELSGADAELHFVLTERTRKGIRQLAACLELLLAGERGREVAARLRRLAEPKSRPPVTLEAVFPSDAWRRLEADDPDSRSRRRDRRNWEAFVRAVDRIHQRAGFRAEGFPDAAQSYDAWALHNLGARGARAGSLPDRRDRGNPSVAAAWRGPLAAIPRGLRPLAGLYLDAGRRFLNLCAELRELAEAADETATEAGYARLQETIGGILRRDVAVAFTKSAVAALFELAGGASAVLEAADWEEESVRIRVAARSGKERNA